MAKKLKKKNTGYIEMYKIQRKSSKIPSHRYLEVNLMVSPTAVGNITHVKETGALKVVWYHGVVSVSSLEL